MTLVVLFIAILGFCIFCLTFAWSALDKREEVECENSILRVERDLYAYHYERMKAWVDDKEAKVDAECLEMWKGEEAD